MTTKNKKNNNPEREKRGTYGNDRILADIENYQAQIEDLKRQLAGKRGEQKKLLEDSEPVIELPESEPYDDNLDHYNTIHFEPDFGIRVVSLKPYLVVLTCGKYGSGCPIYELKNFGDSVVIPYEQLKDFIRYHKNFVIDGTIAILNSDFLKKHDLYKSTLNLLSREQIGQLIDNKFDSRVAVELFESTSDTQREDIIRAMRDNLIEDESFYDALFVAKINKSAGINLYELAAEQSAWLEMLKEYGDVN